MTLETYLRPSQLAGAVPRLAIARTNNDVVITWTGAGFVFESANEPSGDWASVPGAASPYTISSPAANRFYRLRR